MKKTFALALTVAACPALAPALTINLDAESLKDALGAAMGLDGLVVLTAATSGSFFGPTATSLADGDDLILGKWDLSAFATPGVLSATTGDILLGGSWNQGDPLRLYWFPTLDLAAISPGFGTAYGTYTDATGLDGSALWLTPSQGDTINLKFFTDDASFLTSGGSNPASAGVASLTVVPEPGTVIFGACLAAAAGLQRRRRNPLR